MSYSIEQLTKYLGVTRMTVWRWVNGISTPKYKLAKKLSLFIGGDIDIWVNPEKVSDRQYLYNSWKTNNGLIMPYKVSKRN